jgi:hypothetical protein
MGRPGWASRPTTVRASDRRYRADGFAAPLDRAADNGTIRQVESAKNLLVAS